MGLKEFEDAIAKTAEAFKKIDKKKIIRVISHLDTDGICSASIFIDLLNRKGRKYTITILPQLTEENINGLSNEPTTVFVFTDLGSGQLDAISDILKDKVVFILDHHVPKSGIEVQNIHHLNPINYGLDGSLEISGSGVVYLFCKKITGSRKNSHLAVIGAIGDTQERNGFIGVNQQILEDAVSEKIITATKGLRLFGLQTKPIHRLLQYSSDLHIPGITGSEYESLKFLKELGITPKIGSKWRKLNDLDENEKKRLIAKIVEKRSGLENPEDVFAHVYLLENEEENSPFRDAKEFSTLLNACGRMGNPAIGIGSCLGSTIMKKMALATLSDYKKSILLGLNWYENNKRNEKFVAHTDKYTILNAQDNVPATIIGTISSIITKGNGFEKGHFFLAMAQNKDLTTKVSLRAVGNGKENLNEIIVRILEKTGHGEGGGHLHAAGAIIDTEQEEEFVNAAKQVLEDAFAEKKSC